MSWMEKVFAVRMQNFSFVTMMSSKKNTGSGHYVDNIITVEPNAVQWPEAYSATEVFSQCWHFLVL